MRRLFWREIQMADRHRCRWNRETAVRLHFIPTEWLITRMHSRLVGWGCGETKILVLAKECKMVRPLRKAVRLNSHRMTQQFPSERNANMPMQNLFRHRSESGHSLSVHLATSTDTNVGPIRERHSAVKRSDAHAASDRTLETCRSVKRPDMKGHRGYYVLHWYEVSSTGRSVQVDGRSLAGSLTGSKNSVGRRFCFGVMRMFWK